MTTFRSNKSALEAATNEGLVEGQFTITKLATAKYELVVNQTTPELVVEEHPAPVAKPVKVKAQKVDRHWNDDSSLTIYINGTKARRLGGDENEEADEDEMEDPEAAAVKYLNRRFPKKSGGWVWGRTTNGHNWHTKRQKMLRARIAELEAAGQDATEAKADLAKISPK